MVNTLDIKVNKVKNSRLQEVDFNNIIFGRIYSDHMFNCDYRDGQWSGFRIEPYDYIRLTPGNATLHYAQSVFEGLKGYRGPNGEALIFRPKDNFERLNRSAERMCIPKLPEEIFFEGLHALIDLDRDWIPGNENTSLYIRPFIFATDEYIGIRPSDTYRFMIFTCPVGSYYAHPVKVKIEEHFTRAASGGTGYAKAAGNYAASLYPAKQAQQKGYNQLIWTDASEHKYIEESGTMNVMFIIGETLVTPALTDSILQGITRDSVLTLARDWGIKVEERRLAVEEVIDAIRAGEVKEAFGTGTAATIAHISHIGYKEEEFALPPVATREFSNKVLTTLDQLKTGQKEDPYGWVYKI